MMILNIGDDKYIYKEDIVAILNIDTVNNDRNFKVFLEGIKSKGCFLGEDDEYTRSYVITNKNKKTLIHSSIISSKTLCQRNNIEIWR